MTTERGAPWGTPRALPAGSPVAPSDAALAALAAGAIERGEHLVAGVGQGDVLRTLGVGAGRAPGEQVGFSFDLGFVALDGGRPVPFVAHACAHRAGWRGPFAVVMNCAWVGHWYLGPRAHPNDGLLDITVGSLRLRQRLQARTRARTGTHLPHPRLATTRQSDWDHDLGREVPVFADGCYIGRCRRLQATIEADCFTLIV